jgi:hypothetical protein
MKTFLSDIDWPSTKSTFATILPLFVFAMMVVSPDALATAPTLPAIGSGGASDLFAESETTTQSGLFYGIWIVGTILLMYPAYFALSAFADWVKGRKELAEVGGVMLVGLVVVVAGMWLLSAASAVVTAGI